MALTDESPTQYDIARLFAKAGGIGALVGGGLWTETVDPATAVGVGLGAYVLSAGYQIVASYRPTENSLTKIL